MEIFKLLLPNVTSIIVALIAADAMLKAAKRKSASENLPESTAQKTATVTSRPREIELQNKIAQIKAQAKHDLRKARFMFWFGLVMIAFNVSGVLWLTTRAGSPSRFEVVSLCNGVVNCWLQFAFSILWLRDWLAWRKLLSA